MTHIEAMKLIIYAAKNNDMYRVIELAEKQQDKFCDNNCVWTDHHPDCVRAEPEPVKVGRITDTIKGMVLRQEVMLYTDEYLPIGTALYTSPNVAEPRQPQKPLTEDEIEAQKAEWFNLNSSPEIIFHRGVRAAEAAHGIKK